MGKEIQCDCCVVGGGSAGFAAALAAAENGLNTILVEKLSQLGGTASLAGVNCFEPVIGGGKIARSLRKSVDWRCGKLCRFVGYYGLLSCGFALDVFDEQGRLFACAV